MIPAHGSPWIQLRQTAVPVKLEMHAKVQSLNAGHDPLVQAIISRFCPTFVPGAVVYYVRNEKAEIAQMDTAGLEALGIVLNSAANPPSVIAYHAAKNWLLLIEAVTCAAPVDGNRREGLKALFAGCKAGLVFVTAFENRLAMQPFMSQIAWETEVWIADAPDHMIHFNGKRLLGPHPSVLPQSGSTS